MVRRIAFDYVLGCSLDLVSPSHRPGKETLKVIAILDVAVRYGVQSDPSLGRGPWTARHLSQRIRRETGANVIRTRNVL